MGAAPQISIKHRIAENGKSIDYLISMDEKEVRRLAVEMLKEHRTRLRNIIPSIKSDKRKHQAKKKERLIDYTIGRIIFFEEDISTAAKKAKAARKAGEI